MSFAQPRPRQKRELPQPVGGAKIKSKVPSSNRNANEQKSQNGKIDPNKARPKGNARKASKRQHAEDEKEKYLAELTRQAEEAARVLDRERAALTELKIQEEAENKRIQRNRSRHNDHQIDLLSPGKDIYTSQSQTKPNALPRPRKAITPDKMRPSYVDPASVPGLLGAQSRNQSRNMSRAASPTSNQNQETKERHAHSRQPRGKIQLRYEDEIENRSHGQRGVVERKSSKDTKSASTSSVVKARKNGVKVLSENVSRGTHSNASREKDFDNRRKHTRNNHNIDIETPEEESDSFSSDSETGNENGERGKLGKANRLRTVAEEPDQFSDDSSIIFDEVVHSRQNTIVEPEINFSEMERREEEIVAARATKGSNVGQIMSNVGQLLAPADAMMSPGGGRKFMGAIVELKAGPSQQQLERQHLLQAKLKEDLEAQIEEKRMKDKRYRDEQKAREEKEEAEARAYQERLDRLRAASPDTRARNKARSEVVDETATKGSMYNNKEDAPVGISARPKKAIISDGPHANAVQPVEYDIDAQPRFQHYDSDESSPVVVEHSRAPQQDASRVSFGQTQIRRDVAELKEQQQLLLHEIHQLSKASSASAIEHESLEIAKQKLEERTREAEKEADRIRMEAKAEADRIKADASSSALMESAVNKSLQGASIFVEAGSLFLVNEQLLPKDLNYIPCDDELLKVRIDPNLLPAVPVPAMSSGVASPSPDSAFLHQHHQHHQQSNTQAHQSSIEISEQVHVHDRDHRTEEAGKPSKIPFPPSKIPCPPHAKNGTCTDHHHMHSQSVHEIDTAHKPFGNRRRPGEKLQRTQQKNKKDVIVNRSSSGVNFAVSKTKTNTTTTGGKRLPRKQWNK